MKIDIRELITEQVLKSEMCFVIFNHIDEEMWFKSHETFDSNEHYDPIPFEYTILKNISLKEKQTQRKNAK
jgi:hypothetical protein